MDWALEQRVVECAILRWLVCAIFIIFVGLIIRLPLLLNPLEGFSWNSRQENTRKQFSAKLRVLDYIESLLEDVDAGIDRERRLIAPFENAETLDYNRVIGIIEQGILKLVVDLGIGAIGDLQQVLQVEQSLVKVIGLLYYCLHVFTLINGRDLLNLSLYIEPYIA